MIKFLDSFLEWLDSFREEPSLAVEQCESDFLVLARERAKKYLAEESPHWSKK